MNTLEKSELTTCRSEGYSKLEVLIYNSEVPDMPDIKRRRRRSRRVQAIGKCYTFQANSINHIHSFIDRSLKK